MEEKKQLNDEELNQVSGGWHVSPSAISNYIRKDMIFSVGIFGIHGPYPVHIDNVTDGTIVTMTFTDPDNHPDYDHIRSPKWAGTWTQLGEHTWKWDYDDGADTWLE